MAKTANVTTDSNTTPISIPVLSYTTVSTTMLTISSDTDHNVLLLGEFSSECPSWGGGFVAGDIQINGSTCLTTQVSNLNGAVSMPVVLTGMLTIPPGKHQFDLRAYTDSADVTVRYRTLTVIELDDLSGLVNAKHYGLRVTNSGTQNTIALRAAYAVARNTNRVLYIPSGNFDIDVPAVVGSAYTIYINGDAHIVGDGPGKTILKVASYSPTVGGALFSVVSRINFTLEQMTIVGPTELPHIDPGGEDAPNIFGVLMHGDNNLLILNHVHTSLWNQAVKISATEAGGKLHASHCHFKSRGMNVLHTEGTDPNAQEGIYFHCVFDQDTDGFTSAGATTPSAVMHNLYYNRGVALEVNSCEFRKATNYGCHWFGGTGTLVPRFARVTNCVFGSDIQRHLLTNQAGETQIIGNTFNMDASVNGAISALGSFICKGNLFLRRGGQAWVSNTAYRLGDRRANGKKLYQVITAGTSARAGGPTGIGLDIIDGTVHWKYLGAENVGSAISEDSEQAVHAKIEGNTFGSPLLGNHGQFWIRKMESNLDRPWQINNNDFYNVDENGIGVLADNGRIELTHNRFHMNAGLACIRLNAGKHKVWFNEFYGRGNAANGEAVYVTSQYGPVEIDWYGNRLLVSGSTPHLHTGGRGTVTFRGETSGQYENRPGQGAGLFISSATDIIGYGRPGQGIGVYTFVGDVLTINGNYDTYEINELSSPTINTIRFVGPAPGNHNNAPMRGSQIRIRALREFTLGHYIGNIIAEGGTHKVNIGAVITLQLFSDDKWYQV